MNEMLKNLLLVLCGSYFLWHFAWFPGCLLRRAFRHAGLEWSQASSASTRRPHLGHVPYGTGAHTGRKCVVAGDRKR